MLTPIIKNTNVIETVEEKINSNVKSDEKITVKLNAVKNIDGDDDNTVIFKNGNIYYKGVDSSNYDEDFYGAVYDLSLTLTCGDKTKGKRGKSSSSLSYVYKASKT